MSRETERAAITAHFKQAWEAAYPGVPVAWPNIDFATPDNSQFVVFNLVDRGTTRETLGRTYVKRHRGTLQLDIYTPGGQGTRESRLMADYLEALYDSLDLVTSDGQGVSFRTPSARPIAGNEARASNLEDNWDRIIVECPYDRQEVVSR